MLPRALVSVLLTAILASSLTGQNPPANGTVLKDALGDPLPEGAIARLGTLRFKHAPSRSASIDAAVYSPDGTKIASLASTFGSVRVWEADTGKEISGPWASQGMRFSAVAFAPDSARLVVAIHPGYFPRNAPKNAVKRDGIILYDIAKKAQVKTISGPLHHVTALAFADGGKTLVGAGDGAVRWWDLESGKEQRAWQPFADETKKAPEGILYKTFSSCTFSPDTSAIALQVDWRGDENRFIQRGEGGPSVVHEVIGYQLPSGKKYWQSSGKGTRLTKSQFAFSADGKRVAIVAGSEKVELRDGVNGKLLLPPWDLKALVNSQPGGAALTSDGSTLALAGGDANVFLFNTQNAGEPRTFAARLAHNGLSATSFLSFAPANDKLLIAVDSDIQVYDVPTLREVGGSDGHRGWVDHLAFSPDGTRLFTGLSGRGQAAPDLFAPNGEFYYRVGGTRGGLPTLEQAAWDVATWKRLELVSARTPLFPNLGTMSLQQSVFVGKSGADALKLFDIKSGQPRASMLNTEKTAGIGLFSPGGKFFVHYANENSPERIYAVPSGKLVCKFVAATGNANRGYSYSQTPGDPSDNMAFSPSEKLVAQYGRGDGFIRIYDTATGKLLHTLGEKFEFDPRQGIPNPNCEVAFSADNQFMVSWSSLDNFMRLWDMSTGAEILYISSDSMLGPANSPSGQRRLKLAWSADGRVLAMGESKLRFVEMATLGVRRELPGHADAAVRAMAIAPGSNLLATASSDTTVLIWDLLRPTGPSQAGGPLDRGALETRWKALANEDAGAAYAAILQLVSSPGESIAWIKEKLTPEAPVDPKRLETLIENLNDDRFKVRESATAELLQIGARAAPAVDQALATNPNLEMLRRLQGIRKSVTGPVLKGEKLQAFRAIEALEKIATPDAVILLRSLAGGAPGGLLTTQARNSLARLKL